MKLRWTLQAAQRLEEIKAYVEADRPEAAVRLMDRLVRRAELAARLPNMGRTVRELPHTDFREVVEGRYRIVYRVRHGRVEILTVFEGHRLFPMEDLPGEEP